MILSVVALVLCAGDVNASSPAPVAPATTEWGLSTRPVEIGFSALVSSTRRFIAVPLELTFPFAGRRWSVDLDVMSAEAAIADHTVRRETNRALLSFGPVLHSEGDHGWFFSPRVQLEAGLHREAQDQDLPASPRWSRAGTFLNAQVVLEAGYDWKVGPVSFGLYAGGGVGFGRTTSPSADPHVSMGGYLLEAFGSGSLSEPGFVWSLDVRLLRLAVLF